MSYPDYLVHFNKNHNPKNGQFAPGDGDGDGQINDNVNRKRGGVWSAKIENYHKGTMFRKPYYIDKNGNKRTYDTYKDMPYDAQEKEKALAKGKDFAKDVGKVVLTTVAVAAVTAGTLYVRSKLNEQNYDMNRIEII